MTGTGLCSAGFNVLARAAETRSGLLLEANSAGALLGSFRSLAADLAWLRAYMAWERHDEVATEFFIRLSTKLDDRVRDFWLNGARMIAYDFPSWGSADAERDTPEKNEVSRRHAQRAVEFLDAALVRHPTSSALWIERANLQLNKLQQSAEAAESFRQASMQADAPFYAARIHAELLRRLGRKGEALQWLYRLYPQLPAENEAAAKATVLDRIRSLEAELGVADELRLSTTSNRLQPIGL